MRKKNFFWSIVFSLVLCTGAVSKGFCFIETVGGIAVAAGALDALLGDVINKVSGEVKTILNQAKSEAQALEGTVGTDLFRFENMTVADIESLTGNSLNQVDNTLNAAIADITRLENRIDAQAAAQIRDAVHLANITWKNVSKDTEKLVVKFEQGVAVIVDSSLVQLIRIITLICAFVVLIVGVIILIKVRIPGIVVASVGLLIVIFCFTPLFSGLVSNWSSISKTIKLDDSVDPPQILVISPTALKFNDRGTMDLLGMNFLPKAGSSKLMIGRDQNNLLPENRASINPNKISVPLEVFTKASGTYYVRIDRDDTNKSAIFTVYVQRPEQIPVRISYTIWQNGIWSAQSVGYYQIRKTQDDHGWGDTTKSYYETYTPLVPWISRSFSKNEISRNHLSDLTENLSGTGLQINYRLKSGPWWDRWRGWYNADYTIALENTTYGDTKGLAEHGEKTLYFDEETGHVSAVQNTTYLGLGVSSYEMKLGGAISAKGSMVIARRSAFHLSDILKNRLVKSENIMIGRNAFKSIPLPAGSKFKPLTGKKTSPAYFLRPFRRVSTQPVSPMLNTVDSAFRMASQTQTVFDLGQAPAVPGFQSQQTWYDVAVVFGDASQALSGKTGQSAIYDSGGNILMTFYTDDQGELYMTWMHD
jgi:hypothetical protein